MNFKLILDFLSQLKENNNREWFEANKPLYQESKKEFEQITIHLIEQLAEYDSSIGLLKPKDCVFRIFRDVRFSKDKTPYKPNFGVAFNRGGRKQPYATYYLHLEPGDHSMIAGGCYMPQGEVLQKLRQEVDYNAKEFREIIGNKEFVKHFEGLTGDQLKRAPKGYSPNDENIDLLRYKSYIVAETIPDKQVAAKDFMKQIMSTFGLMRPMNEFLNKALLD